MAEISQETQTSASRDNSFVDFIERVAYSSHWLNKHY